jgi:hypothetical protein
MSGGAISRRATVRVRDLAVWLGDPHSASVRGGLSGTNHRDANNAMAAVEVLARGSSLGAREPANTSPILA